MLIKFSKAVRYVRICKLHIELYQCHTQVHFIRSLQRVSKKINPQYKEGKEAFIAVGQQILNAKSADEVIMLFDILRGEKSIKEANVLKDVRNVDTKEWKKAAIWVDWWVRKRHLCKYIIKLALNFKLHGFTS